MACAKARQMYMDITGIAVKLDSRSALALWLLVGKFNQAPNHSAVIVCAQSPALLIRTRQFLRDV